MCHIIHLRMQSRHILGEGPGCLIIRRPEGSSAPVSRLHPEPNRETFPAASKTFLMASCLCCHQILAPFLTCSSSILSSWGTVNASNTTCLCYYD